MIRNNSFLNIGAAIGSHNYFAEGDVQLYHTNITIENNSINMTLNSGIRALNWKDATITGNTLKDIGKDANGEYGERLYGVYLRGVVNMTVKNNTFNNCNIPICVLKTADVGNAGYPTTITQLTEQNWLDMKENTLIDCNYNRIRLSFDFEDTDFPVDYGVKLNASGSYKNVEFDPANCTTTK